jgi:hypothetical protein
MFRGERVVIERNVVVTRGAGVVRWGTRFKSSGPLGEAGRARWSFHSLATTSARRGASVEAVRLLAGTRSSTSRNGTCTRPRTTSEPRSRASRVTSGKRRRPPVAK